MSNLVIVIAVIVLIIVVLAALRIKRGNRQIGDVVSEMCREAGVPNQPFNVEAVVREVVAGRWRCTPNDGQWWVATGIEQVGQPSHTRLMQEATAPNVGVIELEISEMFDQYGGDALMPPHLAEGRFVGSIPGIHPDIIYARITGRLRPIGAWLVAVPPWAIGEAHPQRQLRPVPSRPTSPEPAPNIQRSNGIAPRMGIPIDMQEYQAEVTERRRPGLPQDGRYWVAKFESNEDEARLVWEQAATYHEAKSFISELASSYGKKPRRITSYHVDDVGGIWMVEARGMPYGTLAIFHPIQLQDPFR